MIGLQFAGVECKVLQQEKRGTVWDLGIWGARMYPKMPVQYTTCELTPETVRAE